jgi:hypothetical protein
VAAGEEQLEPFVGEGGRFHRVLVFHSLGGVELANLGGEGPLAADPVDRPVARRADQPGAGAGGDAVARPALRGDREGLLAGFLGEVEVAEEADQGGEDAAPLLAVDLVEDR